MIQPRGTLLTVVGDSMLAKTFRHVRLSYSSLGHLWSRWTCPGSKIHATSALDMVAMSNLGFLESLRKKSCKSAPAASSLGIARRSVELSTCIFSNGKTLTRPFQTCQEGSWRSVHEYECGIFGRLYPKILPTNVRAILRLLLLTPVKKLPLGEFDEFMKLESHLDQWKAKGGEAWENIALMARATKEFSRTPVDETTLQEVFCKARSLCIWSTDSG